MNSERAFDGRVVFDHLPKTAGQAVNAWLTRGLGSGCVTANLIGGHRALLRDYGGEFSVISGHLHFDGTGLDPRYQYISILREPLDRAISALYFAIENHQATQLGELWRQSEIFLETEGDVLGDLLASHIFNPYVQHFSAIERGASFLNEQKLSDALEAIDKYEVVGFYEDLPRFVADVAAMIGIECADALGERVNPTRRRVGVESLSPKLRNRLQQLNLLDLEFYEQMRQRVEKRKLDERRRPVCGWLPYVGTNSRQGSSSEEFNLILPAVRGNHHVSRGALVELSVDFALHSPVAELVVGLHVFDEYHRRAFGTSTRMLGQSLLEVKRGTHRVEYVFAADLPDGEYFVGFNFVEPGADGDRQIAWCPDLLTFRVTAPRVQSSIGYCALQAAVRFRHTADEPSVVVRDAKGSIELLAALGEVAVMESFTLPLRVENASAQLWASSDVHRVHLSYHWCDAQGNVCMFEGVRTRLDEVAAGASVRVQMSVTAPAAPGAYRLMIVPVQEGIGWFDQLGFSPAFLDVVVVAADARRRYPGSDARFSSGCGRRENFEMVGTGTAGILLHGPNAALTTGNYVARLEADLDEAMARAWAEVVRESGTQVLARIQLAQFALGQREFSIPFELRNAVNDLNLRLWVPSGALCTVKSVILERAAVFGEKGNP
jgi:hypothetical protein